MSFSRYPLPRSKPSKLQAHYNETRARIESEKRAMTQFAEALFVLGFMMLLAMMA
jgi:uncharacterized membrane protein